MALSALLSKAMPSPPAPNIQHIFLLFAFFAVIALIARFSIPVIAGCKQLKAFSGLATFARFFYASFLKPHNGDGAVTGQQAALESFYKAQVDFPLTVSGHTFNRSSADRFWRYILPEYCICYLRERRRD